MQENFQLNPNNVKAIRWWIYIAVASLLVSGIFAIPLPAARSEYINKMLPVADVFNTSLVLHVNLSILVWMMSISAALWCMVRIGGTYAAGLASLFCVGGLVAMVAAPLLGYGNPVLSNYIPVLDNNLFLNGLLSFFAGILIQVVSFLCVSLSKAKDYGYISFAAFSSVLLALVTFYVLYNTYQKVPDYYTGQEYYELLFWGAGHVMQFLFVQVIVAIWLIIFLRAYKKYPFFATPKAVVYTIIALPVTIITAGAIYITESLEVDYFEYKTYFTNLMAVGNGISATIVGGFILLNILKNKLKVWGSGVTIALVLSIILFIFGGVVGLKISGVNTTIPAHYHGSLGGITLGMIAFVYYILPYLGFAAPKGKLHKIQPVIYFTGQVVHVIGLYGSGGYGALRKTVELSGQTKEVSFWYGILGLGGGLAILSGLLFAIVVIGCFVKKNAMPAPRDLK